MADGRKNITLALQGGGAHGAFTWGVLDRLLEDDRLVIEGISGTSAGAMNGAVVVAGMAAGGPDAARTLLARFWEHIAESGRFSIFQPSIFDRMMGSSANLDFSPLYQGFDLMTRMLSPYQLNPSGDNPLRKTLNEMIDFEKVREGEGVKLFISTTNVRTGKIRVFRNHELTADVLLASACLPQLFQAVEVDGEHYWDGGFMGNPAMFPLIYNCRASDILLIEINPIRIEELPTTARGIADRMNSISFNATMMREMRTIAFVTRLLDRHRPDRAFGPAAHVLPHGPGRRGDGRVRRVVQVQSRLGLPPDTAQARPRKGRPVAEGELRHDRAGLLRRPRETVLLMIHTDRTVVPHAVSEQSLATLEPSATVVEAARMMAYLRIGALMVVEDGRLVGIFSERDALTRVVAKEKDPATTLVSEVMTPDPITIAPETTVQRALDIMAEKGFRHLPVVEEDRIVAIVSIRDLYRSVKDQMETDILLLAETLLQG